MILNNTQSSLSLSARRALIDFTQPIPPSPLWTETQPTTTTGFPFGLKEYVSPSRVWDSLQTLDSFSSPPNIHHSPLHNPTLSSSCRIFTRKEKENHVWTTHSQSLSLCCAGWRAGGMEKMECQCCGRMENLQALLRDVTCILICSGLLGCSSFFDTVVCEGNRVIRVAPWRVESASRGFS